MGDRIYWCDCCQVRQRAYPEAYPSILFSLIRDDVGYFDRSKNVGSPLASRYTPRVDDRYCRRTVDDVVHTVTAVGSREAVKAQEFIDKFARGDKSIKAYGTYQEVYADTVRTLGNR